MLSFNLSQHPPFFKDISYYFTYFFTENQKNFTAAQAAVNSLLSAEGHTVRALLHCGIAFVGTNQNSFQGAIIGIAAVMCALGNGTFNALIGVTVHSQILLSELIELV